MQAPRPGSHIGEPFKDNDYPSRPWTITITRRNSFGNLCGVAHYRFTRAEDAKAWKRVHEDMSETLEFDIPGATLGDYTTAAGAIIKASAEFIDWGKLHDGAPDAISPAGKILLEIVRRLPT